jgi:hypothetical protein
MNLIISRITNRLTIKNIKSTFYILTIFTSQMYEGLKEHQIAPYAHIKYFIACTAINIFIIYHGYKIQINMGWITSC